MASHASTRLRVPTVKIKASKTQAMGRPGVPLGACLVKVFPAICVIIQQGCEVSGGPVRAKRSQAITGWAGRALSRLAYGSELGVSWVVTHRRSWSCTTGLRNEATSASNTRSMGLKYRHAQIKGEAPSLGSATEFHGQMASGWGAQSTKLATNPAPSNRVVG